MPTPVNRQVQKHRDALREAGLRPIQLWIPDVRRPGFPEEGQRQALQIAEADRADTELMDFVDASMQDTSGWS